MVVDGFRSFHVLVTTVDCLDTICLEDNIKENRFQLLCYFELIAGKI